MADTPNTPWVDGPGGGTPLTAARLNNMEQAIPYELAYNEITSNASITATTAATANTVVTASAITFDGSTVALIEFSCPYMQRGTSSINIHLWDGSTDLGQIAYWDPAGGYAMTPPKRRLTPSAASHTYSIRAYVDAGTGTIGANTGTGNNPMPAFIRITRV